MDKGVRALDWDPDERDAWIVDAEKWVGQIRGVLQCKIDVDPQGEIAGVHVVTGMQRDPRKIVRDVEGLLKARLQMDVNYKKIGVVQVIENELTQGDGTAAPLAAAPADEPLPAGAVSPGADGPPRDAAGNVTFHPPGTGERPGPGAPQRDARDRPPTPAILVAEDASPRIVCNGVGVLSSDRIVRAEVQLQAGDVESGGTCEGTNHADSDVELVARAALDAVSGLLAGPVLLHLREVRVARCGGEDVVLTAIELVEARRSETLFGTCAAHHNRQQAVVYAVLDALNRRLGLQALKEASGQA